MGETASSLAEIFLFTDKSAFKDCGNMEISI